MRRDDIPADSLMSSFTTQEVKVWLLTLFPGTCSSSQSPYTLPAPQDHLWLPFQKNLPLTNVYLLTASGLSLGLLRPIAGGSSAKGPEFKPLYYTQKRTEDLDLQQ
jgi:hypothetical protein